jgi:hypothetical protein
MTGDGVDLEGLTRDDLVSWLSRQRDRLAPRVNGTGLGGDLRARDPAMPPEEDSLHAQCPARPQCHHDRDQDPGRGSSRSTGRTRRRSRPGSAGSSR